MPALRKALAVAEEAFSRLKTLVSHHEAVTCGGGRVESVFSLSDIGDDSLTWTLSVLRKVAGTYAFWELLL